MDNKISVGENSNILEIDADSDLLITDKNSVEPLEVAIQKEAQASDVDPQVLAEIEAIQSAIEGQDTPIEDTETAAGNISDGGRSSAVEFSRDASETIASSEFETQGLSLSTPSVEITDTNVLLVEGTVNEGPTLSVDNGSIDEDSGSITVNYNAADVDGTIQSTIAMVPAEQGIVSINETDSTITFTPAENFHGDATITLTSTDNDGAIVTATSTISVADINDGPTLNVDNGALDEDSGSITVPYTAADVDGTIISTIATVPAEQGLVTINETDGTITFTPVENFYGDATITLTTTDDDGAVATATSTISVADINDGPTLNVDNGALDEDSGSITVPYTAADVDGTIISTIATVPAEQGLVTINETDGTITFTPAENFHGDATITLTTTDDDGAVATATSTISVADINDAPTVDSATGSTQVENVALAGDTVATFTASDLDGDDVTFSISSGNDNNYFEITDNSSGVVTLTALG
ncbi:MAG: CshA-type fibril repeat protein, partial [Psychromonas sp.]|uniref:tandem-95 repeat protein n=1 Tax=Psychromonas sp. TaxID=1884585 RepID=UPI0039E65123